MVDKPPRPPHSSVPRFLEIRCSEASRGPGPIAISETKDPNEPRNQVTSTSSVRDPRALEVRVRPSSRQRLGTFISSVALLPGLDRSLDDLAPSPHRRPWPLVGIDAPPTWVPRSPRCQSGTWGLVPHSSTSQGDRSTSLIAGPRYQVVSSARGTK